MIVHYFPLLSIIFFPSTDLKHFSFCKSSQIGNAQIPEESLGGRRSHWEEEGRDAAGGSGEEGLGAGGRGLWLWQDSEKEGRAQKQQRAGTSRSC